MARRKKHAEQENHERWMVSYADFITLMFAFFVVMFASSQTDQGKAQQVAESVRKALEDGGFTTLVASILGGTVGDTGEGNLQRKGPGGAEVALHDGNIQGLGIEVASEESEGEDLGEGEGGTLVELRPALEFLREELREELEAGTMELNLEPRGLVVSFQQAAFFPSGEDVIKPEGFPSIEKVARTVNQLPNPVRMEGHTDSVPIHNARFRSNWELSAARSVSMLRLFAERFEVPLERMSIAAYAENAPVATNDTAEGRGRNRRVDIILLSEVGIQAEPGQSDRRAEPHASHGMSKSH